VQIKGLDMSERPDATPVAKPKPKTEPEQSEPACEDSPVPMEAPSQPKRRRSPGKEVVRDVSGEYQQLRIDDVMIGPESVREAQKLPEKPQV
jgi:hypothetical protein